MKRIITLIVFLTYSSLLFSQEKDSLLVGEWKVISIETNNYYYDSTTDTFKWSKSYEKMLPALMKDFNLTYEDYVESTKKNALSDRFVFQSDNTYLRKNNKALREGNYTVNKSDKTIFFADKNSSKYKMEYYIKKGILYLKTHGGKTQLKSKSIYVEPTKFILQKA